MALDYIPLEGDVSLDHYQAFVKSFRTAFKGKTGGGPEALATASRLLAMKRPDYFVCIDSKNKKELCRAFDLSQKIDYDAYWESLCQRIHLRSAWWSTPEPKDPVGRRIWQGRTALLDALFYVPE
jgi:hypothetical protein